LIFFSNGQKRKKKKQRSRDEESSSSSSSSSDDSDSNSDSDSDKNNDKKNLGKRDTKQVKYDIIPDHCRISVFLNLLISEFGLVLKFKKTRQNTMVNLNSSENLHFMLWPDQFQKICQIKAC
jgi:hypothetical protein